MSSELPPSKLGTKKHWDDVYSLELTNFEDIGDEGEIWFGEDSVEKMLDWTQENIPKEPAPSILEIGSGNGALLFALHEAGYNAQFICGADYSEDAVNLARAIGISRGEGAERVTFAACDFLQDYPRVTEGMSKPDDGETKVWDLVLDKGTFDAIALAEKDENGRTPADKYPSRIAGVVKPGGHFLIVSCNFTEGELKERFATQETGLHYQ
ncbi:hypothetical protein PHLCEN_2v3119 [Hermanssonia centrifuga]|uniref:Protein-lysine N-methyltransferase EFM4 n=1 Tax=Hermanssonia centrifuga TaxID=98765 RepID=A0A2R6R3Y8_9APHY|nr:hypothetical protein PHLCEN_2v3119 [Hermanssonia centrifuga]